MQPGSSRHDTYGRIYDALGIIAFICWSALILSPPSLPARGFDFRIFYTAASISLDAFYDLATQAEFQQQLWAEYGAYVTSPFPRPAFYRLLLLPLATLSYETALHLWLGLLCAAFITAALLIKSLYGYGSSIFFFLVSFYPVSVSLRNGQDSAFLLLALLAAVWFLRKNRPWAAALFLGFCLQKFNLLLLLPVVLATHRRWGLLARLATVGTALAAISFALVGPSGVRDYLALLTGGALDEMFYDAWNVRALVWHLGWNQVLYGSLLLALAGWSVWLLRCLPFETALWAAIPLSTVLSWHCYSYDFAVSLPFVYLLWVRHRAYLGAILLGGGLWTHFFLMERISWLVTLLLIASTVELYMRIRHDKSEAHGLPYAAQRFR